MDLTKAITDYGLAVTIALIFLSVYLADIKSRRKIENQKYEDERKERKEDIEEKRKERKEDRLLQKENNRLMLELVQQTTKAVESSTDTIKRYGLDLSKHTETSGKCFKDIDTWFNHLDDKLDIITKNSEDAVTKEMANDIREDIKCVKEIVESK